jgi:surface protein
MLNGCIKLTSVTSANWDTSNVSDMYRMFYDCRSLKSLDLSSCRPTISGTDGCDMFANCYSLEALDIRNFNISYYDSEDGYVVKNMFKNCNSLHTLYLNNCNTYTLKQILLEVPSRDTGITGIIYLKQANLRDEGKEIYLNGSCPAGWKFEYVD